MPDLLAGTDTEAAPDNLRAEIEAAFNPPSESTETGDSSPPDEAGTPAAVPPEAAATAAGTRPRDAGGKFIPKTEAAPEKAAPVSTEIPSTDTAKANEPAASTPAPVPPAGWTAAAKAEWSKVPPSIQAEVSRREQEMTRGGQQWSEEKRRYEGLIAPVAQAAQRRGLPVDEGLNRLVRAQDALDSNPAAAIAWLARSYGVDLATLAGQSSADGSREANPQSQSVDIAAMVRQAVMPYVAPIHERIAFEERQRSDNATNLVNEFAAAPGHEHFDNVQNELMAMIPQIKAANPGWAPERVLQEAYDRAVYANPTTRASVLDATRAADEAKRQEEARARVTKARTAASSVTGSPIGTQSTAPKDSLRAELEAAFSGG